MPVLSIQKAMMKRAMEAIARGQEKEAGSTRILTESELREGGQRIIKRATRLEKLISRKYPDELAAGIKVEMEHTNSLEIAKIIALDHLADDPEYYSKLVEAGLVDEPEALEILPGRLEKSGEWKQHKYVKKVGNKYFYSWDEVRNFKLTRKKDGFFYMDDQKITNDPEKARQFEEKIKEQKETRENVKIGDKVQIKGTQKGSMGRGIVAMVKEIEEGFARVMDEAGRYFRVPTSALVFAKSLQGERVYVVRMEKAVRPGLVATKKRTKDGRMITYWTRPGEDHSEHSVSEKVGPLTEEERKMWEELRNEFAKWDEDKREYVGMRSLTQEEKDERDTYAKRHLDALKAERGSKPKEVEEAVVLPKTFGEMEKLQKETKKQIKKAKSEKDYKNLTKFEKKLDKITEGMVDFIKGKKISTHTDDEEMFRMAILKIISEGRYREYGLRVNSDNPITGKPVRVKIGDEALPSYYQPDGERTEVQHGTSAIHVGIDNLNEALSALSMYEDGNEIVLLGTNNGTSEGNDISEIEMNTPTILAILGGGDNSEHSESNQEEGKSKWPNGISPGDAEAIIEGDKPIPEGWYVHGRASVRPMESDSWPTQFTRDIDVANGYGGKGGVFMTKPSKDAWVLDFTDEDGSDMDSLVEAVRKGVENGWSETQFLVDMAEVNGYDSEDKDGMLDYIEGEVRSNFSPSNIVNSAQAFDDGEWIGLLGLIETRKWPDWVITPDGAVLIPGSKKFDSINLTDLAKQKEIRKSLSLVITKSLTWSGHKLQGRTKVHGMDISIENRKGSVRRGKDKDGHEWATKMHYAYGYIRGTVGKDKDHLDCYIGPNPECLKVFVVHQNDPVTGKYDEDKVMLGFESAQEAKAAYLKQYDRPGFFGSIDETDIETFKAKVFSDKWKGRKVAF